MNLAPVPPRGPTPRERAYLEALAAGEIRPAISGQAGHMCRKFGWCEILYYTPAGAWVARSALPGEMDSITAVKHGYRAEGFVLTPRGRTALERGREADLLSELRSAGGATDQRTQFRQSDRR